ncbi:MAG: type II secretion system protein GspG [Spirochaetes bacterium]|nr:type II secretion system protein GspG [Spirochaetota bacterium]
MKRRRKIIFLPILLFLLLAIAIQSSCNSKGTTKDIVNAHITRESIKNAQLALELYRREFGSYPETLDELLSRKNITERSIIEDAWGRTYHYVKIGDTYELFSVGRDGTPFTQDDIRPD